MADDCVRSVAGRSVRRHSSAPLPATGNHTVMRRSPRRPMVCAQLRAASFVRVYFDSASMGSAELFERKSLGRQMIIGMVILRVLFKTADATELRDAENQVVRGLSLSDVSSFHQTRAWTSSSAAASGALCSLRSFADGSRSQYLSRRAGLCTDLTTVIATLTELLNDARHFAR